MIYRNDDTPDGPDGGCGSEASLFLGDCRGVLAGLDADIIDLTVTSPPYDNLRTYKGNVDEWGERVWKEVIQQLYRVTKPGGVVVWVVGDATVKGSETGTSFRQALWAKKCGFNLHDTMIYQKAGTGACGSRKAYWQGFEYMFVFSRGQIKTVNKIADRRNKRAGTVATKGRVSRDGREKDNKRRTIPEFSVRDNVWRYHAGNNGDDKTTHPAKFPEKLARDHIISWSNKGDTVLDPFMGSGTAGKEAARLARNFIGIELDAEYYGIAHDRVFSVPGAVPPWF